VDSTPEAVLAGANRPILVSSATRYDKLVSTIEGVAMAGSQKRAFELPAEQAAYIDGQVASGAYASASEVVGAGLRALQERDAGFDRWLREDVAPTFDRWKAGESATLSGGELSERVLQRHAERLKG